MSSGASIGGGNLIQPPTGYRPLLAHETGVPAKYRPPRADTSARADIEKAVIDGMVAGYGEFCTWEKAATCGCRANSQTDQPRPGCPACAATGFEYYGSEVIRVVFERADYSVKQMAQQGEWWSGQATATVLAETPVGYRHRLTMRDAVIEFTEVIERPAGQLQRLRYPVATKTMRFINIDTREPRDFVYRVLRATWWQDSTPDALAAIDVASVLATCTIDGDEYRHGQDGRWTPDEGATWLTSEVFAEAVAAGQAVLRDRLVLEEGLQFQVTSDGLIDWAVGERAGQAPPAGAVVAFTYLIHPRWVVTTLSPFPQQNWWTESGVVTPTRLLLPTSMRVQLDFLQLQQ